MESLHREIQLQRDQISPKTTDEIAKSSRSDTKSKFPSDKDNGLKYLLNISNDL